MSRIGHARAIKAVEQIEHVFDLIPVSYHSAILAGTSTQDVTSYLDTAIAASASDGFVLALPPGKFVHTGLEWVSGANIRGAGYRTLLYLANSSNTHSIASEDFATLTGGATTDGIERGSIENLRIDGNRSNNTTGHGLAIYGDEFTLYRLWINNVAEIGLYSEWYQYGNELMEASADLIRIDTCGKHGVHWKGPHDSVNSRIFVVDAGQTANNTYDGFLVEDYGAAQWKSCHAWHRSTVTNRMRYSQNHKAYGATLIDPHAEGARSGQLRIAGQYTKVTGGRAYASFGGAPNVIITAPADVKGVFMGGPASGEAACAGLQIGEASGDNTTAIQFEGYHGGNGPAAVFTHEDGKNDIRIYGVATDPEITGTPNASSHIDIRVWDVDSGAQYVVSQISAEQTHKGPVNLYPTNGLTAAGTTQSDAYQLTNEQVITVGTTAAGTGVKMVAAVPGRVVTVTNLGANLLAVYPATGEQFAGYGTNAPFYLEPNRSVSFASPVTTSWNVLDNTLWALADHAISAAGTVQGDATALSEKDFHHVGTVGSGAGVRLPLVKRGKWARVWNAGANALKVYPSTGDNINALSANVAVTIPVNGSALFWSTTNANWRCQFAGVLPEFAVSPGGSVTPATNGDVVMELTSNTTLTFKAKGSDGTVRSGTVTLS